LTSAAVTGRPSLQVASGSSRNVHVVWSSDVVHDEASPGRGAESAGEGSTSIRYCSVVTSADTGSWSAKGLRDDAVVVVPMRSTTGSPSVWADSIEGLETSAIATAKVAVSRTILIGPNLSPGSRASKSLYRRSEVGCTPTKSSG
jgi:hypothetical protein